MRFFSKLIYFMNFVKMIFYDFEHDILLSTFVLIRLECGFKIEYYLKEEVNNPLHSRLLKPLTRRQVRICC